MNSFYFGEHAFDFRIPSVILKHTYGFLNKWIFVSGYEVNSFYFGEHAFDCSEFPQYF